jgi:hypothetical protein
MEKDLAISSFNEIIHIRRGEEVIRGEDARLLITRDFEASDTNISGRRGIG